MIRKSACTESEVNSGYKYIETTIRRSDRRFVPDNLAESIGKQREAMLVKAYHMLGSIGKTVVTALLKSCNIDSISDKEIDTLMQTLPDDGTASSAFKGVSHGDLSCTMHRLCKYKPLQPGDHTDEKETLRGHTDWTLMTLVPVSPTAGLEIFDPCVASWVSPERYYPSSQQAEPIASSSSNARYIIIMAGKWLELLTRGNIHAAIHRVVARKGEARLSNPFFYRPMEYVPLSLQAKFGEDSDENIKGDCDRHNTVSVQETMGKFIFLLRRQNS